MKKKILIVDDEQEIRHLLRLHLEQHGYEVVAVGDALAAILAAQADSFDLYLLDVQLPVGNGILLMDCLRARATQARVPVIILTGRSAEFLREEALRRGAHDFLQKPLEQCALLPAIRAALGEMPDTRAGPSSETCP